MNIVVRRSGGPVGLAQSWRVDTESCDDPDGWYDLVDALPREPFVRHRSTAPDDPTWTVTVARTTVTIPGAHLEGPWALLVERVRDQGEPT